MQEHPTPSLTGHASAFPQASRKFRLIPLLAFLTVLTAFTTGVLGYQIGRGESARIRAEQGMTSLNKVFVASLKPIQAPTTLFDRLSLLGAVREADGTTSSTADVELWQGGKLLMSSPGGSFAFTNLAQGAYTLRLAPKGGMASEAQLTLLKTQEADRASLTLGSYGVYSLVAAPWASSAALDVRIEGERLLLSLSSEAAIGLKAYQTWDRDTPVHLFDQREGNHVIATRDGVSVIAPGSGGSFIFAIENPDRFPLECRLTVTEEESGDLRLPMRYRLREDVAPKDEAAWGEWQKAEEVLVPSVWVPPMETRYFTLQWRWHSGDNALDTAIGSNSEGHIYRLRVNVIQTIPQPDNLHL